MQKGEMTEAQEQGRGNNVMDIMYQMMFDEKKFGLDKKKFDVTQSKEDQEFMNKTRTELI